MDGLSLSTTSFSINQRLLSPFLVARTTRNLSFSRKHRFLVVASSSDDSKLDSWDHMELKFGQMLGEDPKLTLAKIRGRKLNPDATFLDIEKSFYKNKGKITDIEEIPLDWSKGNQPSNSVKGVNLVRPILKKGFKFEAELVPESKKPNQPLGKGVENTKRSIPNVILRKPAFSNEVDVETEKSSGLKIKPNLSLKMGKDQPKEKFSDMTLLRKPKPTGVNKNVDEKREPSSEFEARVIDNIDLRMGIGQAKEKTSDISLLKKPEAATTITNRDENLDRNLHEIQDKAKASSILLLKKPEAMTINTNDDVEQESFSIAEAKVADNIEENNLEGVAVSPATANEIMNSFEDLLKSVDSSLPEEPELEDGSVIGLQPLKQSDIELAGKELKKTVVSELSGTNRVESSTKYSGEAALQGKPRRLDQSVKETSNFGTTGSVLMNPESYGNAVELETSLEESPLKEREDTDWARAEDMVMTDGREEVELISSSTRGFVVSFGSLIGFLPYRNLAAKWKFLAFESWLRMKGLNPSMYKQNLSIIGSYNDANKTLDSSIDPDNDREVEGEISPDMKWEDLLSIYEQEKIKFLLSFVGQRIKVNVVLADRKSRKLIFSVRPKEKEELVEKKKRLMAKLSIGDVVKCCIKKITYFGIFVEVEGVPALVHQTEVSWDATLDPASYYKIGQIVEAKVHQLDFSLERIFLSLKEITPDPLIEALESVVGDRNSLGGTLEAAEADTEWADVEALIKELEQTEGIQSVSKGRYFLSPGLAPTFQVYMASMFENQYKLLARSGNKVQEVIVQSSLGKEEVKSAILACTNRVG